MGADIFALDWIQATIKLFTLFGWALFIAGVVVAIFDVAIEYQAWQSRYQDHKRQYPKRLFCLFPHRRRAGGTV
ncbi:MAG: conjugal transfer protein TrbL family protein [Clostridia bacterium]